jgi:putative transport protein
VPALRENEHTFLAAPDHVLRQDGVVLAVAANKDLLEQARAQLGEVAAGHLADDRHDLDYLRVFASSAAVVGRTLGDLSLATAGRWEFMNVRRGDTEVALRPDLVLESGDRVGLLAKRSSFPDLRKLFGDSIKSTAQFSYIGLLALGFLVGAVHIPVPGIGSITIGLAGVLLIALVLGKLRRTAHIDWTLPLSANLVVRNLGLTLFLAQVGMSSGPTFVATVAQVGLSFLGLSAVILCALVLPVLLIGIYVLRLPFDLVSGIVAGAAGNPAILAFSSKLMPTERPDLGYAMIFPGMTIVKILIVDIAPAVFGR